MGALEVASLFGVLDLRDELTPKLNNALGAVTGFGDHLDRIGGRLTSIGGAVTTVAAPIVAGLTIATTAAMGFNESMTNVGAILGRNQEQMADLSAEVLAIGTASREGPQAAAEAFYDIVGGVADASTHMAILEASIATAEAGSASLAGTTGALISIMNSYGFSAEQASFASDVLTRTVGVGVGSMEEFAAALPQVAGLASSLGIEFDDLGSMMAFITTRGFSASEAATQLRAMMTALLNPNERMKKALAELGVASGEAAIEQYGLTGAFMALQAQSDTFNQNMAGTLGSVEALNGVIALTGEGAAEALEDFSIGLDGATAAARAIQLESPAAQFDLLKSQVAGLAIELGTALLPLLNDLVASVKPVIENVIAWVKENPELVTQIAAIAGAAAVLGPVLIGVGGAVSALGTIIAAITSPVGIAVAAVVGLVAAYNSNFLGLRDFVDGTVRPALDQFFVWLGGVWEQIRPGLEAFYNWFVTEALPEIIAFVTGTVLPAVQDFFNFLGDVWALVSPALGDLFEWFMTTGLPAISNFVTGTVLPAVRDFANFLGGIWEQVRPALESLFNWFRDVFTQIGGFIQDVIDKFNELKGGLGAWSGVGDNANVIGEGLASGQFGAGDVLGAAIGATLDEFGLRDKGGEGRAGQAYMIGRGAQPELFVPGSDGWFFPNADRLLAGAGAGGGGMQFGPGSVVIHANSYEEGRAAAAGFEQRMNELRRRNG